MLPSGVVKVFIDPDMIQKNRKTKDQFFVVKACQGMKNN